MLPFFKGSRIQNFARIEMFKICFNHDNIKHETLSHTWYFLEDNCAILVCFLLVYL